MSNDHEVGGGGYNPTNSNRTAEHYGCSLDEYADAKKLPLAFLQSLGISTINLNSTAALRIPYCDNTGKELAVRLRTALDGSNKFRWRKSSKPTVYLPIVLTPPYEYAVLVEGESDCHTLWYNGIAAFGLPGAGTWKEDYVVLFDDISIIYVIIEPDAGGQAVLAWLKRSQIRYKVSLVRLDGFKDPSAMYIDCSEKFKERWLRALTDAQPYQEYERTIAIETNNQAWVSCQCLAVMPDILAHFEEVLKTRGMVGQTREAKLLFLIFVSRFLQRPVSCKISGPSSGGKSYLLDSVLAFMPESAYYFLTAMSDKALAYSEEPLKHRMLILAEASALQSDMGSYLIRTLLSEGRINYAFVEKTNTGMQARVIIKEGPTGFITTTTAVSLHSENETRLMSLSIIDTKEHTAGILLALADEARAELDFTDWHALQIWLESSEHIVVIPYGSLLAKSIPPVAVRLRRDFAHVLNLIRSHAILHQTMRKRDAKGWVIATLDDYAAVRALIHDLIAVQLGASVPKIVRETVEAVKAIIGHSECSVSNKELGEYLKLDKSAISNRVKQAIHLGYLINQEIDKDKKGKSSKLVLGEPMPEEQEILPTVERLREVFQCSNENMRDYTPIPIAE